MSSFQQVIDQIKESSDNQTESNAYYLSEIQNSISNLFKPISNIAFSIESAFDKLADSLSLNEETELPSNGNEELLKVLNEISKNISNIKAAAKDTVVNTEKTATVLQSDTTQDNTEKSNEAVSDLQRTVNNLAQRIETRSAETAEQLRIEDIQAQFELLRSEQSQEADQFIATYDRIIGSLNSAIERGDAEAKAIALEQLEQLQTAAEERSSLMQSEEDRREENKTSSKILSAFNSLENGLKSISQGFDDILSAGAQAAGIAGIALLFLDPETAFKLLETAIEIFVDGLNAVSDLMNGSTEGLMDFIKNNPITSLIGSIFLVGKAVGLLGGVIGSLTSAFTAISGGFTAISGAFTGLSIGLGPLIGIIAAVGVAVYSLFKAFGDALDVFGESGSFVSALKEFVSSFFANFFGTIANIIKSLGVMILEFFGFEKLAGALSGLDFVSIFKEKFSALLDVVIGIGELILSPFKLIFNVISGIFGGILDVIRGVASVIEGIFTGDFGQIVDGIKGIFGGLFGIITAPFEALADFVVEFIDTIVDTIKAGLKLLNPFSWFSDDEDDVQKEIDEQKNLLETRKDLTAQEREAIEEEIAIKEKEKKNLEQEKNLEYAKDFGLFEKNIIGESEVNMEKIAEARTEQLEAILELENDDISDEAKAAIEKQILKNKGFEFETTENFLGMEVESISQDSLQNVSTESINEMLSMSEGALNDFTRMRLEEELAVREAQKESGEKRGMEIPAQSGAVVSAQDPLTAEIEKLVSEDATKEAILNKQTERANEKISVLEEKQTKTAEVLPDRTQQAMDYFVNEKNLDVKQAATVVSSIDQVSGMDETFVNTETNQVGIAGFGETLQNVYKVLNDGDSIENASFKEQLSFLGDSLFGNNDETTDTNMASMAGEALDIVSNMMTSNPILEGLSQIGDVITGSSLFTDIAGAATTAMDFVGETVNNFDAGSLIQSAKDMSMDYISSATGLNQEQISSIITEVSSTMIDNPLSAMGKLSELITTQEENSMLSSVEKENEMSSMIIATGGGDNSSKTSVTNNNTNVNTTNALPDQLVRDFMYKPTW